MLVELVGQLIEFIVVLLDCDKVGLGIELLHTLLGT